MKCKHPYPIITEESTASTIHMCNPHKNGMWQHDSDFGNYTGVVIVECQECGYKRRFTGRRPNWVVRALGEAIREMDSTGWRPHEI